MALLEEKYQSMNGSKIFLRSEKREKLFATAFEKMSYDDDFLKRFQ